MSRQRAGLWTNSSVLQFAGDSDPLESITRQARQVVLDAIESGWEGPPFDPFELAERLGLNVVPKEELADARTVPVGPRGVRIEFNPNRPVGRLRYSLAHEIAHSFFPDCGDTIRQRTPHSDLRVDDGWQLELLCNVGAAEILMPLGTFLDLKDKPLSVDELMDLRKLYDVSTEAMFLRVARLTDQPCSVFAAARVRDATDAPFRIDYLIPSRGWRARAPASQLVPPTSVLAECTAVGFTAKGQEKWTGLPLARVECVGVAPYPGSRYPRIVGILCPKTEGLAERRAIHYRRGDALEPRGSGLRIIAHVVNDKTPTWGGGGFAAQVRRRWSLVQEDFKTWAVATRSNLQLGQTHYTKLEETLGICHMIAQHGYGPSVRPRLRYSALKSCLEQLADLAEHNGATVHMPRIGTGNAGGSWPIIAELVEEALLSRGIDVTVYEVPGDESPRLPAQRQLALSV